jgi:hypothetical protein
LNLDPEKERTLHQAEETNRIYIYPVVLRHSDRQIRARFTNVAAIRRELWHQLSDFPVTLLRFFVSQSRGQIVLTATGAEYNPKTTVAQIGIRYLADNTGVIQEEVTHLFDHLLGSNGQGPRMSEGHGINRRVEQLGQQIKAWYDVKADDYYDRYAARNEREYLAQAVRKCLYMPDLLKANDVEMFVLVRDRFLNDSFWREVLSDG